jgi:hypothetical protein
MAINNEEIININNQDIFSEYLNINNFNKDMTKEEFIKPNYDYFDQLNSFDEKSIKSLSSIKYYKKSTNQDKLHIYELKSKLRENVGLIINNNDIENLNKKNFNGQTEIDIIRKQDNNLNKLSSKIIEDNSIQNKDNITKEIKNKKLLSNRESAKKSRLKKKAYIENLEKQYLILKTEYIRIIEKQKLRKTYFKNEHYIDEDKINPNLKIGKENVLYDSKNNNDDYFKNKISNNYYTKQKKIIENLLVNQIDIMTPINIKILQNKFLKLYKLENNDNFQIIRNKIDANLETIKELYDINENDKDINKKSKGYQLFEFYSNISILLNRYEVLYKNLEDTNCI